jgi:hypothetical protein
LQGPPSPCHVVWLLKCRSKGNLRGTEFVLREIRGLA